MINYMRSVIMVLSLTMGVPYLYAATNEALDSALTKIELDMEFSVSASSYVALVKNNTSGNINSGVLVFYPPTVLVVTNYHLISSTSDSMTAFFEGPSKKIIGFNSRFLSGDPVHDVAVLEVMTDFTSEQQMVLKQNGFEFAKDGALLMPHSNMSLDYNQFIKSSVLMRGREVFFLGFPLEQGIGKEIHGVPVAGGYVVNEEWVSKTPIVRFGRIASEVQNGEYLIDAMVNHGNSGSPVFVLVREPRPNGVTVAVKFAGIIKGFLSDNIVYKSDGGHLLSLPHNSGLGLVISAEQIASMLWEKDGARKRGDRGRR